MEKNHPTRKTVKYIDPARVKSAARIQTIIGAFILIFSGVVLYSLPAGAFYLLFIIGSYFFFSGILITFSIVSERTARKLARFLIIYWVFKPKQ